MELPAISKPIRKVPVNFRPIRKWLCRRLSGRKICTRNLQLQTNRRSNKIQTGVSIGRKVAGKRYPGKALAKGLKDPT